MGTFVDAQFVMESKIGQQVVRHGEIWNPVNGPVR
jgi:hypothetical protein